MILVTGGTGLLGSRLLLDLVKSGKEVRVLKRKTSDTRLISSVFAENASSHLLEKINWVDGDVLEIFSLTEAMQNVTHVYHCAGVVSFNKKDEKRMQQVNINGTENVVNASLEARITKLCHVSSIASLGRAGGEELISEETHWRNSNENTFYAFTKYSAEREVWRGVAEGLNAVIVNPSVIIGHGDFKTGSTRIFDMMWKGLKFYSEGINGFVDVRDVSKSMIMLMNSDIVNERFIISSENKSYKEFIFLIADHLGKRKPFLKANRILGELAWRMDLVKSKLTGAESSITKETVKTAIGKYFYANEKIKKAIGIEFIPLNKAVENACKSFLKSVKN